MMKKNAWPVRLIAIGIFGVLAYFSAVLYADTWDNLANTDFMTLWLAGKSVVMGFDAYDPSQWTYWREYFGATWIFDPRFVFPLPLRLFLTPLGFLELPQAFLLWAIISQGLILFSVAALYLSLRKNYQNSVLPFLLFGALIFHPTILALRFGQMTPWLLISLVGTIILWEREQWFWGGVILSLVMLKPTIGGLYIIFGVWLVFKKLWPGVAGMAVGGISLLLLGIIQDPQWVMKFLQSGNEKMGDTFAYGPNVWGFARFLTDGKAISWVGGLFALILIAVVTMFAIKQHSHFTPAGLISLITPVVLMTTPYIWGYDQIFLLVPLTYLVVLWEERNLSFMLRALFFVLVSLISYLLILPTQAYYYDYFSVFLPLIVLILLMLQPSWRGKQPEIENGL